MVPLSDRDDRRSTRFTGSSPNSSIDGVGLKIASTSTFIASLLDKGMPSCNTRTCSTVDMMYTPACLSCHARRCRINWAVNAPDRLSNVNHGIEAQDKLSLTVRWSHPEDVEETQSYLWSANSSLAFEVGTHTGARYGSENSKGRILNWKHRCTYYV